jgi:hypothetical protein
LIRQGVFLFLGCKNRRLGHCERVNEHWFFSGSRVLRCSIPVVKGGGHRSSGSNPVCLAMRANMRGPISSPLLNAKV